MKHYKHYQERKTDHTAKFSLSSSGFGTVQEKPPELLLASDFTVMSTEKTDIW